MGQKRLALFREIQNRRLDDEMFVDLTIFDVPASLLKEFGEKIIRSSYPSGVSEAIKDLIRKAVLEYDLNNDTAAVIAT
jgi:metal-responsive CopG/Arc/MetJ family transcriptional regulator